MKVIFGKNNMENLEGKYIVLELDTFKHPIYPDGVTCYGIISADDMLLGDIPKSADMLKLHESLLNNYKKQRWEFCEQTIKHLMNFWPKGYDEFYTDLLSRITAFKETPPGDDWTPTLEK